MTKNRETHGRTVRIGKSAAVKIACRKMNEDVAYAHNTESGCKKNSRHFLKPIIKSNQNQSRLAHTRTCQLHVLTASFDWFIDFIGLCLFAVGESDNLSLRFTTL